MRSSSDLVRLVVSTGMSTLARRRVFSCTWELTYRCNARCGICAYWRHPSEPAREMSLAQLRTALERVARAGCRFVNFTGGEPTLRRDLEEIVASAARLGIWTSMVSNGGVLTRERVRALRAAGLDMLLLSVDSLDASAHDAHRGIPGLHARVLELLRWLPDDFLSGSRTGGMMCVLSASNLHQVPGLVALARQLGVRLVLQPYHPNKTGDAQHRPAITADAVQQLLQLKATSGALLSSTRYLSGIRPFCEGAALQPCQAGRKYFSIDPYGDVRPCVDGPRLGHVTGDGLERVRSAAAAQAVSACRGCWYCFRGEADSTLTLGGYLEKLRLAADIVVRNASRSRRAARPRPLVPATAPAPPTSQPVP